MRHPAPMANPPWDPHPPGWYPGFPGPYTASAEGTFIMSIRALSGIHQATLNEATSGTDSTSGGQLNLTITITRSNPRYHHPDHVCPYYLLLQTWSPRATQNRKHISPTPNAINVYQSASTSLNEPLKDEFVL